MNYPRVNKGGREISARLLNDTARLLERFETGAFTQTRSPVMAGNDTGGDLSAEVNVVSLVPKDAPIDPKLMGDVVASAIKPDGVNPVAFLPLCRSGEVVRAAVVGVVIVDILMASETDTRADAIVDETRFLGSGADGPFEILVIGSEHTVGADSVRRAAVRIGGGSGGGGGSTIKLVQAQAAGEYGQVSVKDIILKSDLSASPNFEVTGDAYNIAYLKV